MCNENPLKHQQVWSERYPLLYILTGGACLQPARRKLGANTLSLHIQGVSILSHLRAQLKSAWPGPAL